MKWLLKTLLLIVIIILSLTSARGALAEVGSPSFSMKVVAEGNATSPGYFVFDTVAGSVISGEVLVQNTGTAIGTAHLYAVDATTGQTSGTVFLMLNDPLEAAGAWIALETDTVTLNPGMGKQIPFTVTIPESTRAGHHVGGLVLEALEQSTPSSSTEGEDLAGFVMEVQTRSAMAVQVNVSGTAVSQLDALGLRFGGHTGRQILYLQLRNSGNQMIKPNGTLEVYNSAGELVQDLQFNLDTFLPDTTIEYPIYIQDIALSAGTYSGDLRIRYQIEETTYAHHQFDFTVSDAMNMQIFSAREPLEAPDSLGLTKEQPFNSNMWVTSGLLLAIIGLVGLIGWLGIQLYKRNQTA